MPKLYFITMQLLDRLLEGIPEQELKDFQSYSQLHLKHILTTINKNKLEDTTQAKVTLSFDLRSGSINVLRVATSTTANNKPNRCFQSESSSCERANRNAGRS
jgi:hypothetical protein